MQLDASMQCFESQFDNQDISWMTNGQVLYTDSSSKRDNVECYETYSHSLEWYKLKNSIYF